MKKYLPALLVSFLAALPAKAANLNDSFSNMLNRFAAPTGYNTAQRQVEPIINNIILVVLSFLGVIFVGLIIYGGFIYMTAQGDKGKIKTSTELIAAAVIGLIIIVAAYAVTYFVLARFTPTLLTQ